LLKHAASVGYEGKGPFGKPRHRWEDKRITNYLCEIVDWI
jgi:hypothetical protein